MTGGRWVPRASLDGAAAYFISQALGAQIKAMGRERSAFRGQEWLGRVLLESADELKAVGAAWFAAQKVDPDAIEDTPSVGRELTVLQAVEVIGIGERAVRKVAGKAIAGRQVGGRRWLLEEWSVLAYRDRVSSDRGGRRNSA